MDTLPLQEVVTPTSSRCACSPKPCMTYHNLTYYHKLTDTYGVSNLRLCFMVPVGFRCVVSVLLLNWSRIRALRNNLNFQIMPVSPAVTLVTPLSCSVQQIKYGAGHQLHKKTHGCINYLLHSFISLSGINYTLYSFYYY